MLDFTNFREHPEKKEYMIFHFTQKERSFFFEEALLQKNIDFEKHVEEDALGKTFFAIKRRDFRVASEINDESRVKFRQPFIADTALRYVVLSLFIIMMGLAIAGMITTSL
jgi:hypothetical protein